MPICNNKKCSLGKCDQPETCAAYVPVVTNADHIRAMSDYSDFEKCEEGRKRWLKQSLEGEQPWILNVKSARIVLLLRQCLTFMFGKRIAIDTKQIIVAA